MAKLKAHGKEIGTIYTLKTARRYMSDGHVLKNHGFGWKLHATVKAGLILSEVFARAKAKQDAAIAENPAYAKFRAAMLDACGLGQRWKLLSAIELMPDDCDGVWSECCDGYGENIHMDVDEVGELCRLYQDMMRENTEKKAVMAEQFAQAAE